MPGPNVPWAGRRHGRRKDRRWGTAGSPEQICNRLRLDFPGDDSMRISHEAIYQALYIKGVVGCAGSVGAREPEAARCRRLGYRRPRRR